MLHAHTHAQHTHSQADRQTSKTMSCPLAGRWFLAVFFSLFWLLLSFAAFEMICNKSVCCFCLSACLSVRALLVFEFLLHVSIGHTPLANYVLLLVAGCVGSRLLLLLFMLASFSSNAIAITIAIVAVLVTVRLFHCPCLFIFRLYVFVFIFLHACGTGLRVPKALSAVQSN